MLKKIMILLGVGLLAQPMTVKASTKTIVVGTVALASGLAYLGYRAANMPVIERLYNKNKHRALDEMQRWLKSSDYATWRLDTDMISFPSPYALHQDFFKQSYLFLQCLVKDKIGELVATKDQLKQHDYTAIRSEIVAEKIRAEEYLNTLTTHIGEQPDLFDIGKNVKELTEADLQHIKQDFLHGIRRDDFSAYARAKRIYMRLKIVHLRLHAMQSYLNDIDKGVGEA